MGIRAGISRVLAALSVVLTSTVLPSPLPARGDGVFDPAHVVFNEVAAGLTRPVFIGNAGDGSGRLFVVEQAGYVRIVQNGSLVSTSFLDIHSDVMYDGNERGMLGLAFHPDYASNGQFYVAYVNQDGDTNLSRFLVSAGSPDEANPDSESILLTIPHLTCPNHYGGMLAFGPDTYLYMSTGDGGGISPSCGGDQTNEAQSLDTLLGKILRLDVDSASPYAIPTTNPFYNEIPDPSEKQEIWAYGLRNPWRMSFDRGTGDLYIADVGQSSWEEVDYQAASSAGGENYGWHIMEGTHCYNDASESCDQTDLVLPVVEYNHTQGCSITGGYVYRGAAYPAMDGQYFYSDYCSGIVWAMYDDPINGWTSTEFADTPYNIVTFGEDEQGELYFSDLYGGGIYQVQYAKPAVVADFDGDETSDIVVYRGGAWLFHDFDSAAYTEGIWTGAPGGTCIPAPMDYDGDGRVEFTELCDDGAWHFFNHDGSYNKGIWIGIPGAVPVPADYDGNDIEDVVAFDNGAWQFFDFTTGDYSGGVWTGLPGGAGTPAPMDYNGDGTADPTILAASGAWHFFNDDGTYSKGIWTGGVAGDVAVPGKYSGGPADDIVVFSGGAWQFFDFATGEYLPGSSVWTGAPAADGSGVAGPAPLDYNGDGTLDFTYYGGGAWHFYNANGSYNKGIWTGGVAGDVAVSRRPAP